MNGYKKISLFILVVLTCMGVTGCASFVVPEMGSLAKKSARVALDSLDGKQLVLQTDALKLEYSLQISGASYRYDSRITVDRSISDSFGTIVRLFIKMNFLDSSGRVIESIDVTPLYGINTDIPPYMSVKKDGTLPAGATHIAFNYYGTFRGSALESNDDWDISYWPFD